MNFDTDLSVKKIPNLESLISKIEKIRKKPLLGLRFRLELAKLNEKQQKEKENQSKGAKDNEIDDDNRGTTKIIDLDEDSTNFQIADVLEDKFLIRFSNN
eukprot:NODE_23_length_42016_cov_0.755803.p37 type:complete len:100 gc:universal NODE_23_length_42016_cov_0.755803:40627-40328(-)